MTMRRLMARRLGSNGPTEVSDLAASSLTVVIFYTVDFEIVVDYFLDIPDQPGLTV